MIGSNDDTNANVVRTTEEFTMFQNLLAKNNLLGYEPISTKTSANQYDHQTNKT